MALIDIEFQKFAFEALIGLTVKTGDPVPFPTLPPIGGDRLILNLGWQANPALGPAFPGYVQPPGTALLHSAVVLTYASFAEIEANPVTAGTALAATAWILATAMPDRVVLALVGFDPGTGPVALAVPQPLGQLPLPAPSGAGILRAAIVADAFVVTVRFANSSLDDPLQPSSNRLQPGAPGGPDWLVHVPAQFFVDSILTPFAANLSPPPDGAELEVSPHAGWMQFESGAWGVYAAAGVKKIDACPGIFDDVDMSVAISAAAEFTEDPDNDQVAINLTLAANASDWDSFRCWLGSLGALSLVVGIVNPYVGAVLGIASLVAVSEDVRESVGDAATSGFGVPGNFTKVSQTTSTTTYAGSFPIDPIPLSIDNSFTIGPTGLDISGSLALLFALVPAHDLVFSPERGPLRLSWKSDIDCSLRSMAHPFAFQDVLVSDTLKLAGKTVTRRDVKVYLTSTADPAGKIFVEKPDSRPDLPVRIRATGAEGGFAVLHTSAGLRGYVIAPLPAYPNQVPGIQHLIDVFCDSFRIPIRIHDFHDFQWVEPPPEWGWGYHPLRQWQIVLEGIGETAVVQIRKGCAKVGHLRTAATSCRVPRACPWKSSRMPKRIWCWRLGMSARRRPRHSLPAGSFLLTVKPSTHLCGPSPNRLRS